MVLVLVVNGCQWLSMNKLKVAKSLVTANIFPPSRPYSQSFTPYSYTCASLCLCVCVCVCVRVRVRVSVCVCVLCACASISPEVGSDFSVTSWNCVNYIAEFSWNLDLTVADTTLQLTCYNDTQVYIHTQ